MNFLFNINVCRVCMQNEQSIDLCNDKDLLEKFIFTTRLVVSENDNLPKVICANCTARLKIAHKFIKTAHESENNLKNFLAKINTEFKEVSQGNKDNNKELNETNPTEDEILSLVENEDETTTITQTKVNLKDDNKTENKSVKRKLSATTEYFQKKSKTDFENINPKPTIEIEKFKDVLQAEELQNIKKEETVYHLSEEVLLIHEADNNETECENDANPNENDETQQQEHTEEDEHDNELEEEEGEEEEENHEELENSQTNINTLGINEESQTQSQLTELTLDNSEENANEIQSIENDGYLREYESMLINNQVANLEYQTEFVDENSVEEVTLSENTFYIQNIERDEVHDGVDGDDGDDGDDNGDDGEKTDTITVNELGEIPSKSFAKKEMRRFYCEQCQRDFSTKTNLNRHMQSHEGNKPFPCAECGKSFTQKSSLKQHMFTHTGEKPYVCEVCDRGFTQCKSLIFHMRRHTGEKPFQCEYCLITFRQKDALRIHILKHHVIFELTAEGIEIFTCIICQKKFNTKTKFKTHVRSHTVCGEIDNVEFLQDDNQMGRAGLTLKNTKNQKTEIVILTTLDAECLDANVVNVAASSAADASRAKKFQCGKCFKCFALKKSLIRHMRIHSYDLDDGICECIECDLKFLNTEDYEEHMTERHHFTCSGCPEMIFKTAQDLKMHMFEHELEQQEELE